MAYFSVCRQRKPGENVYSLYFISASWSRDRVFSALYSGGILSLLIPQLVNDVEKCLYLTHMGFNVDDFFQCNDIKMYIRWALSAAELTSVPISIVAFLI